MIAKKHRLTTKEFDQVFSKNTPIHSSNFIFLRSTADFPEPKFGVAISKKKCRRRIDRNLHRRFIYRRLRELILHSGLEVSGIVVIKRCLVDEIKNDKKSLLIELTDLIAGV